MKTLRAKTMVELKQKCYDAHGRKRKVGESMSLFVKQHYDVHVDHQRGDLVAVPKKGVDSSSDS